VNATQRQRLELAHETLDEIRILDAKLKRSRTRITHAVTASGTSLTDIFGVGPILAALIIGYTRDVGRFPSAGHFAAYNGTAPVEFSSSGRTVHRLSRRGNRTLNHAIHMIAVTQIRNPGSEGRDYYDNKLAAGRTKREAIRALKRRISDRVYNQLRTDARNK
jgi:transposase